MAENSVIIIGSGIGGLECAFILAKHGYKVTVLEKERILGGSLQTFVRKGSDGRSHTSILTCWKACRGRSSMRTVSTRWLLSMPMATGFLFILMLQVIGVLLSVLLNISL